MTKPKATVLEIEKFNQEPEDKYYPKIKFKDPDTGEQLIGEFKLWSWNKLPVRVLQDIRQRLATPIINIAYGRQK
jgi:hypothetical protein